ncbi:MAG: ACP S-malonyltransferase [Candidatus Izemoplasma sp.]|nr:ACP S-malonyltransferase [Candidatus Izemoplasma sp.]
MKLGFMFTGQGSERVGMGTSLLQYDSVKTLFNEAEAILEYNPESALNDPKTFEDTQKIQPLTFLLQVSLIKLLAEKGIHSDVTFGLSLGEYAAMYDASVFDFKTGLALLQKRGELMQKSANNHPGAMCALIGLEASKIETLVNSLEEVVIANYNTPKQLVISGDLAAVKHAADLAKEAGAKRAVMLPTTGAFHSFLMKDAAEELTEYLNQLTLKEPTKSLYVNVTGDLFEGNIKDNMIRQMTSPVKFYQIVEKNDNLDVLIEIGPKRVLCNMVKRINRKLTTYAVYDETSLHDVLEALENEI